MKLAALIQKGGLQAAATATVATVATHGAEKAGTVAGVAGVAVANPQKAANDALPDPATEARRQRVSAILGAHPGARYAAVTDMQTDSEAVILALAIRGCATCELRIPREKWDGVLFLDLLERHGATVH